MATLSFLEHVFPTFAPPIWQGGVSIYQSGGVTGFACYSDLTSARVKGITGEWVDVRVRLHGGGRVVQYMECSCPANRRKSERCPHLAAFCISLDQDHSDVLTRFHLAAGRGQQYLSLLQPKGMDIAKSDAPKTADAVGTSLEVIENLFSIRGTVMESLDMGSEEPWVAAHVVLENKRKISYRVGVDDTLRLIENENYRDKMSDKLRQYTQHGFTAERFFEVKKHGNDGLLILRSLRILKAGEVDRAMSLGSLSPHHLGRSGLFLRKVGFIPFADGLVEARLHRWEEYPREVTVHGDNCAWLVESQFARLRETASVEMHPDVAQLQVESHLQFSEIKLESSGAGWFDVGLRSPTLVQLLEPTGHKYTSPTNPVLMALLRARHEGRNYIATKKGWIKIGESLDWLKSHLDKEGRLRLSTQDVIKVHERLGRQARISGQGDVVKVLRSGLVSQKDLPLPTLSHTHLSLRPYQEEGVRWLYWLWSNSLGGLLADDMGLGKTHQAMALLSIISRQDSKKGSLVVCPTSVIDHWLDKLMRYVPGLQVVCYRGTQRKGMMPRPGTPFVLLTSYGILLRDVEILEEMSWNAVILDEAHLVKNQSTRTYRAACRIPSRMRLCLTGTPLENDIMELKNLFDFIAPGYLGSDADFRRRYGMGKDSEGDPVRELELQRLIHPFKMRRAKKDVLHDLPEKVEDVRHCHMHKEQQKLYNEALALKGAPLVERILDANSSIPYVHVFSVLSLLKQICDDPALVDPAWEHVGSGKLDLFDELLDEALESQQKVVVFSQYAKMVHRLSERMSRQGIAHVCLTGQSQNRGQIVKKFQEDPKCLVFVGSLLAGGTGIDLTAASVVIHFDRWWNAAKENQATDRIHRIGQHRNVQVYKLVTRGTVEERIDELIARKRALFDRFVDQDQELFRNFTREELLSLLSPSQGETVEEG